MLLLLIDFTEFSIIIDTGSLTEDLRSFSIRVRRRFDKVMQENDKEKLRK
jgi:hypothetical protein